MKSCHYKNIRACRNSIGKFRALEEIVAHYIENHRKNAKDNLEFFKKLSFEKSIEHAAFAKDYRFKRFSHQRRLKRESLQDAYKQLVIIEDALNSCKSFEDVFKLIDAIASSIGGLGELYVYDTALRISANLNFEPTFVYLHAGTRIGAKQLRIPVKSKHVELKNMRKELWSLKAYEIEDLLCIYKNQLGAIY